MKACKEAIKEHGLIPNGQSVVTAAGHLPYRFVIHTIIPEYSKSKDVSVVEKVLNRCFQKNMSDLLSVVIPLNGFGDWPRSEIDNCIVRFIRSADETGILPKGRIVLLDNEMTKTSSSIETLLEEHFGGPKRSAAPRFSEPPPIREQRQLYETSPGSPSAPPLALPSAVRLRTSKDQAAGEISALLIRF